jgi:hypothetical protein
MRRTFGTAWPHLRSAGAAIALLAGLCGSAAQERHGPTWFAGPYSFSDELGGFRIVGASGSGSKSDPFLVTEEFTSASPATMVIRATTPIRPFDSSSLFASGFMHMRIVVLNNSGLPWVEFEFELQETYRQPSVFGDGLSFDQRRNDSGNISSDSFARFNRTYEPYDRLLYREGKIDPLRQGAFSFFITDFTPRSQFYLLQDPRIPSS